MYAQFIVITGMATDAVLFEVLCSEDFIEDFIVQNKLINVSGCLILVALRGR